jgi:hypothetical protein
VLRIAIAIAAGLIAMGGVVLSRVRAHKADVEGRLEHEMHLVEDGDSPAEVTNG